MSTRSRIAIQMETGAFISIYCHFDGSTLNRLLNKYYRSKEDAEKIINLGDASCISENRISAYKNQGEKWSEVKPKNSGSFDRLMKLTKKSGGEYLHLFKDDSWKVYRL